MAKQKTTMSKTFVQSVREQQMGKNALVSGKKPPTFTENNSPQSISAVAQTIAKKLSKTPALRGYNSASPDKVSDNAAAVVKKKSALFKK